MPKIQRPHSVTNVVLGDHAYNICQLQSDFWVEYLRRNSESYKIWLQLRDVIENDRDGVTIEELVEGINRGVGEELVLKLQKFRNAQFEMLYMRQGVPEEAIEAIMAYRKKDNPL